MDWFWKHEKQRRSYYCGTVLLEFLETFIFLFERAFLVDTRKGLKVLFTQHWYKALVLAYSFLYLLDCRSGLLGSFNRALTLQLFYMTE